MAKTHALPTIDTLAPGGLSSAFKCASLALVAAASVLFMAGCSGQDTAGDNENEATISVCSTCHGRQGRSISSTFPNLAGQQKEYLIAQLKAFRDKSRADPHAQTYMWGMAANLDDATIARLAAYYSAQRSASGSAQDPTESAEGKNIFEHGTSDKKIPPCVTCHGAKGEGAGTTPRLAGQHRALLERELAAFAANTRANVIMHQQTMNLTDRQISDVSAYLAGQSLAGN
jgi:cytochrome c553